MTSLTTERPPGLDETAQPRVTLPSHSASPSGQRLLSLDILRGFTMFWITGGRELVLAVASCLGLSLAAQDAIETQVTHPRWEGFVAWDMIMPVFLFVVGAALPLAMAKRIGQPLRPTYWRIGRRVVMLWILGILIQLMRYHSFEIYSNTLQAIAVGYLVTSIALLHLPILGQIVLFFVLLIGYWVLLTFVSFGGYVAGTMDMYANVARHVDVQVLGAFRRHTPFTWVLSSLGFSASVLLGAMAGHILRARWTSARKLAALSGIGLACAAAGWIWSYWHPLNRHLWTSSMVLWAGGISFLLVALFHLVVDLAKFHRWGFFFLIIGTNALLAYALDPFVDKATKYTAAHVFGWLPTCYVDLLGGVLEVASLWALLWILYRKRLFLKA